MISGCKDIDVCGTRIASPAFAPDPGYKGYSVIRRPVLFFSIGGGKNGLRSLRLCQAIMVRSQTAAGARLMSPMLEGEARETGVAGEQSVLQQTVCLLCGTALPGHDDQRRCPRNTLGLEDGQGARQAVHARAGTQDRNCGSQGHWGGRNRDPQGTYVSHRRERPFCAAARSGLAARTAANRAWTSSLSGWGQRKASR